jgi:hypothetical protein
VWLSPLQYCVSNWMGTAYMGFLHNCILYTSAQGQHVNSMKCKMSFQPESIEWFIEDQAFSLSYYLAPPPPLSSPGSNGMLDRRYTGRLKISEKKQLADGRWVGGGGAKVTGRRENLVFYISFNNLWLKVSNCKNNCLRRNAEFRQKTSVFSLSTRYAKIL